MVPTSNCHKGCSDRSSIHPRCQCRALMCRCSRHISAFSILPSVSKLGAVSCRWHQLCQIADSAHLAPLRVPAARMSEQTPRCRLDRRRRPRIGSADASGLWPKIQMLSEMQQSFISLHLYLPILRPSRRKTEALRRAGSGPSGFRYL